MTRLFRQLAQLLKRAASAYRFARRHGTSELIRVVVRKLKNKPIIALVSSLAQKIELFDNYSFLSKPPAVPAQLYVDAAQKSINWFIPHFGFGSGGHLNIFRFVHHLERRGYKNHIIIVGEHQPPSADLAREQIRKWFFPVEAGVSLQAENAPPASFNFATSWMTAYHLRAHASSGRKLYFVQDFEPFFYAHGSEYAFAEATYRFGFTGVTAGTWLSTKLADEFGMRTYPFGFSYDRELYAPRLRREPDIKRLFFYARPPTARRGFELGLLVLQRVVERLPNVKVIFAGWDVSNYNIPFEHLNAGVVALDALADLYSQCDVALILSFSNVSLLPLEVMACGLPVVTNRGANTEWLLRDPVVRLADPDVFSLSDAVIDLFKNDKARQRLGMAGLDFARSTSWDAEADRIVKILNKIGREMPN